MRSSGGSEAVPSVEKNLAVDNVGSKALHVVLLLLLQGKHQSVRVANPSDKVDKAISNLLKMQTNEPGSCNIKLSMCEAGAADQPNTDLLECLPLQCKYYIQ